MPLLSDAKLRITYYVRMNNYLALALLLTISGLLPLAIDIVTADTLAFNKLLLDVAGELFTIGFVMAVFVGVLILVPSVDRMPINSTGNSSSMSAHPAATPTRPGAAVAAVVLRQPPFARGNVPPAIQTTGMEPPKPQNIVRQGRGANSPLGRVHSVVSSVDGGEANNDRRTTSVHHSQSAIKSGGSRQGSPQLKRSPEGFYSVEQAV